MGHKGSCFGEGRCCNKGLFNISISAGSQACQLFLDAQLNQRRLGLPYQKAPVGLSDRVFWLPCFGHQRAQKGGLTGVVISQCR